MAKKPSAKEDTESRKPPWLLGAFVFLLLLTLVLLQSSNWWKNLTVSSSSETLLLYALSSLNFVAFLVFALILIRSLLKLRQERRALQLGSKLKTKLLIYFAGITLIPLIAMAVFSYLFMNRALERWFSQMPENVIRQAGKLQDESVANYKSKLEETARMLAGLLKKNGVDQPTLDLLRKEGNLAMVEVVDNRNKTLFSSGEAVPADEADEFNNVVRLLRSGDFVNPELSDGNGYDAAMADLGDGRRLLIVPSAGPKGTVGELVNSSLREFDRLKASQVFVRQLGLTTLGLLTFLMIFASSWAAFYVAKGLTKPIRALAEGADEVARGNYSHRVSVLAEDEHDLLVRAFNTMTEKLEANSAEIQERRKYIETILQSLSAGVISFDSNNRVTTINRAAIEMLRLEKGDFADFELDRLVNEENRVVFKKLISRALRIGVASEQTILFRENTDGREAAENELPVAVTASALPDKNGTVMVLEDLTELVSAQRAAAWQEVARRMAHEIKNPLTPIQLSAERIAKHYAAENGKNNQTPEHDRTSDVVDEGTDIILREVASLKSMVDEFSRFARLPDADRREIDLKEVIGQTVALYDGRDLRGTIIFESEGDLPPILADAEQIKRVFVNLIDNAREAFDENAESNEIKIHAVYEKSSELIRVEVLDNGSGIEPQNLRKLFQPYFSTKGRGTGLGLAIVQRIIRDHQGKIAASAIQPRGSKFTIEFPV